MGTRLAFALAALGWVAVPGSADIVPYNSLSYNLNGQPTAHFQAQNGSFFDLLMDVEDINNTTVCIPVDPCFPSSPTSRQFDAGYFKLTFQALVDGNTLTVTGAVLNQQQTQHDSFFDVFFEVDLGGGVSQEAAFGIDMVPNPPPIMPVSNVTTAGQIGWRLLPMPPLSVNLHLNWTRWRLRVSISCSSRI